MTVQKILLISPAREETRIRPGTRPNILTKVFRHSQQLGLLNVASSAPEGIQIQILDENIEPIAFETDAELIGISCMTATAERAYEIADQFRDRGKLVILGGYHPTFMPEEAKAHADAICIGEAEGSFPQMIEDLRNGGLKEYYRSEPVDLAKIKTPDRSLIRKRSYIVEAIHGSRGCNYNCIYCSGSEFYRHRHRTRPIESVVKEIEQLGKHILFLDSNIIGDRQYARSLFTKMKDMRKKWISQCSIEIADDPELLELARASGCFGLFIGLETLNQANLDGVHKHFHAAQRYRKQIATVHGKGIPICAGLMFGMDEDRKDIFDRTLDFLFENEVEAINAFIITPFPGTRLYREWDKEERIFDKNWSNYDYHHAVFYPKHMEPEELEAGEQRVLREFYSAKRTASRIFHSMSKGFNTVRGTVPLNIAYCYLHSRSRPRIAKS